MRLANEGMETRNLEHRLEPSFQLYSEESSRESPKRGGRKLKGSYDALEKHLDYETNTPRTKKLMN